MVRNYKKAYMINGLGTVKKAEHLYGIDNITLWRYKKKREAAYKVSNISYV